MASSTVPATDTILRIPLDQIVPSKNNQRKAGLDDGSLRELASSIKANGVIVPIKLRDIGEKKFRIVFGERRFRASLLAFEGGTVEALTIPATVHQMSDAQEEDERAIENLQRADLAPLEEAHEFKRLLGPSGDTAALAARLGKEESYIVKRLKLLAMIPEAQKALQGDSIQLGHALEICRLDPENQKRVLKFLSGKNQINVGSNTPGNIDWHDFKVTVTVESLRQFIQKNLLVELSRAKFDLKDPDLNKKMGACTACPHNTANNGALFSDIKSAKCTLPECFFGKVATFLDNQLAALAAERGVEKIYRLSDGGSSHDNRGLGSVEVDGYYSPHNSSIVLVSAGKECEYTVPAVFVHVDEERYRSKDQKKFKLGDETNVCLDPKCKKHRVSSSSSLAPKAPLKGVALVNHKESNLGKSRKQRTRLEAFRRVCEKAKGSEFAAGEKSVQRQALSTILLPYVVGHLYSDRWRDAGKALGLEKPKDSSGRSWQASVTKYFEGNDWALAICIVMMEDIPENSWHKGPKGAISTMAALYKVDLSEISRELQAQDKEAIQKMRDNAAKKKAVKPKKEKKAKAAKKAKAKKG